jgi:hypothetical protein
MTGHVVNFTNILRVAYLYKSFCHSFFCSNILGLNFFGATISAQKQLIKCWCNWPKISFWFFFALVTFTQTQTLTVISSSSISLSLPHTHTHNHEKMNLLFTHTHNHIQTNTHTILLTQTRRHNLLSLIPANTESALSHTISLSLSLTHTHTHTLHNSPFTSHIQSLQSHTYTQCLFFHWFFSPFHSQRRKHTSTQSLFIELAHLQEKQTNSVKYGSQF